MAKANGVSRDQNGCMCLWGAGANGKKVNAYFRDGHEDKHVVEQSSSSTIFRESFLLCSFFLFFIIPFLGEGRREH